ncbi:MAG: phage holin family protein [Kineosporiaceae bacterium]
MARESAGIHDHPPALNGAATDPLEDRRSLGALVSDATEDISALIRHEVALAKAELKRDVVNAGVGAGLFAGAGYLVFLASILLVIAGGYGLTATGLPAWAAFLILAGVLILLAGVLALIGKVRLGRIGPPERTLRSTKATLAAFRPGH